jgi:hypothetical protein
MKSHSRKQIQGECRRLTARLQPIMVEHFDTWLVIGVRAGEGPSIHIRGGYLDPRMDHELIVAAEAAIKRSRRGKKKQG